MSKVKTSVIYPRWANKYLPNTPYQNGTSRFWLTMDDKVITFVDSESEDGIPDLLETLERFGIHYDHHCEALDGDPAYVIYTRSRKDGSTKARHVCESDRLLDVGELIKLLDGKRPLDAIRKLCLDVDNDTLPLKPNIRDCPEQEYQDWHSCKPRIFRLNITNVYRKTTCYAFDHVRPGFCTIFGVTGHLIESRQDDSKRHNSWFNERQLDVLEREFPYVFFGVTGDPVVPDDGSALLFEPGHPAVFIPRTVWSKRLQPRVRVYGEQIDQGERLYPGVKFFMAGKGRVAAFISPVAVSPMDIPDLTMAVTEYLETLCKGEDA